MNGIKNHLTSNFSGLHKISVDVKKLNNFNSVAEDNTVALLLSSIEDQI